MELLLDTHVLLWFLNGDGKLPDRVRKLIEDEENIKYVSIASVCKGMLIVKKLSQL